MNTPEQAIEKRIEAEQMQDVLLLLQNLANSEEATIKLIIDRLYDLGSATYINRRVRLRPLNRISKSVAKMSKPVFRIIAWRWFKKNSPTIIANWLYFQVTYVATNNKLPPVATPASQIQAPSQLPQAATPIPQIQPYSPSQIETLKRENQNLRYQVRWFIGISFTTISALAVIVTWQYRNLEIAPFQRNQQINLTNIQSVK